MMRVSRSLAVLAGLLATATIGCGRSSSEPTPAGTAPQFGPIATLAEAVVTDALVNVTAGSTDTDNFPGQSVMVPAGSYGSLRFNWYDRARRTMAFGTLYLLSQEYLGHARDLPSAPGVIAKSALAADGEYTFPSDVIITGGRHYWFYADTLGRFANSFDIDVYAGGDGYNSSIHTLPFRRSPASSRVVSVNPIVYVHPPPGVYVDNNFRLRGAAVQ